MKKLMLVLGFAGFTSLLFAQDEVKKDNYPYHTLTKKVQKRQYRNVEYTPAEIIVGEPSHVVGKSVHKRADATADGRQATVALTGYPKWVISKGVARRGK